MFRQVYWQHTVRVLKAMLMFAARRIAARERADEERWNEFRLRFYLFVIAPMSFYNSSNTAGLARLLEPDTNADDLVFAAEVRAGRPV